MPIAPGSRIIGGSGPGARNSEIAQTIGISPHTVTFHVSTLLRRTGTRNRAELAAALR